MSQTIEVRVPDLGNFSEVAVIDVMVKPGDRIEVDTPLITLETEKATMDVPSTAAGVVEQVHVQVGGKVSEGSLVVTVRGEGGQATVPAAGGGAGSAPAGEAPAPAPASPAQAAAAAPTRVDVVVPDMGSFTEVSVIDVLVKKGDRVEVDTPLATLETEKATMDVPSTAAGVVEEVHVQVGGKVSAGARVVTLASVTATGPGTVSAAPAAAAAAAPAAAPAAAAPKPAPAAPAPAPQRPASLPPINEAGFSTAHASPSVRKLARELGVDLSRVKGSGQRGRITHDDVKAWVKAMLTGGLAAQQGPALPQTPKVDFAKFGEVEVKPLGRIQKISGPRLHASWVNIPHVTQFEEADVTELEVERAKLKERAAAAGVKITPLAFIVRAVVMALKEFPTFNASLDGDNVVLKKYFHIGFAADTPQGLLVPVIHEADKLDLFGIARALGDLSDRARKGTLKGSEMQGGCFTISSLGGIGGTAFTPIINAPEVAILGVSRLQVKPVWDAQKKAFVPRQMLPLSLSYDHRLIDGALGARFAVYLAKLLGEPAPLLAGVP
jgi:pyruvate dehydrogenase E2 component (dihydrolipoamide acetyltransferase)